MSADDQSLQRHALELFDQLIELEDDARTVELRRLDQETPSLAAEVRSLLTAEPGSSGLALEPLVDLQAGAGAGGPLEIGELIGAYRVHSLLGRGGMGAVYLGERTDGRFDGEVAIKVVSGGGPEMQARFRRERRLLARLDHPTIARILDAGVSERNVPYLVMERVQGEPLSKWATGTGVSTQDIVRLFVTLCEGIQHAHQMLVVHRDLKPANVLVDSEPAESTPGTVRPRILDFGIAKLAADPAGDPDHDDTLTQFERAPMTPAYASPEQIRGQPIGTEADVYALGVMLFEALTTTLPFPELPAVLTDRVRALESRKVPSWREAARAAGRADRLRRFDSDLDRVLERAMHPDPSRRYTTAAGFGADLEALLKGEPVSARRDSWAYRTRRFIGRHRLPVAISAITAIALLVALNVALDQRREALLAQGEARQAAATAQATSEFLAGLLEAGDPSWYVDRQFKGPDTSIRDIVLEASRQLEEHGPETPLARAHLHHVLGNTLRAHTESERDTVSTERAKWHFRQALRLRREALPEQHPMVIESLYFLGTSQVSPPDRLRYFEQAMDLESARIEPTSNGPYLAIDTAIALVDIGDLEGARGVLDRSADWLRPLTDTHALSLHALSLEIRIFEQEGNLGDAARLLEEYGRRADAAGDPVAQRMYLLGAARAARWAHDWPRLADLAAREHELLGSPEPPANKESELPIITIDLLVAQGRFGQAEAWFPSSDQLAHGGFDVRSRIELLGRIAPVEPQRCRDTAGPTIEVLGERRLEAAEVLVALSGCLLRAGEPDSARAVHQQARTLLGPIQDGVLVERALSWSDPSSRR